MTKADQHPGQTPRSAEARDQARITKAFQLFDAFLPPDNEWSHESASVITITSNNPMVDGESVDQKAATFDPKFSYIGTFFDEFHIPRKIELFKYKVLVEDASGALTPQFRRHIRVTRLNTDKTESTRAKHGVTTFVLHEPNTSKDKRFPRRLEVGKSKVEHDQTGSIAAVTFKKMTITDGSELALVVDCLQRANPDLDDPEAVELSRLTPDETNVRRDRARSTLAAVALQRAATTRARPTSILTSHEDDEMTRHSREAHPRRSSAFDEPH